MKQQLFCQLIGKLILWAYDQGYGLTFGEATRSELQATENAKKGVGIVKSNHLIRLAVDFNLFIDEIYQTDSGAYKALGDYWKSLHPLCRWGGDFKKPDGNHFSFEHNGIK